ncbi:MAG: aminotransferase class IV [Planctomycetota bacterium]
MGEPDWLFALTPEGAKRIDPVPPPDPFYSLYNPLKPGLYEAARTWSGGRIFRFEYHNRRMLAGCEATGLQPSLDEAQLRRALQQAMDAHPSDAIKLRWDLGPEPYRELGTDARMIATLTPLQELPDWLWSEGARVATTHELVRRNPTTKGSAFAVERNRISYGHRELWEPVLLSPEDYVLEGAQSNFGAFFEDRLFLPTRGVLPGITITTLLDLAEEDGIEVVRDPLPLDRAYAADEAFLCSSVRALVPIGHIDGRPVGTGHAGPRVAALRARYLDYSWHNARRLFDELA